MIFRPVFTALGLGRIRKDLAIRTSDPAVRTARLQEALGFYQQAYGLAGDTFPGINAATLALLVGDAALSQALATKVRDRASDELEKPGKDRDSWLLATLAEAYLLLGDNTAAKGRYAKLSASHTRLTATATSPPCSVNFACSAKSCPSATICWPCSVSVPSSYSPATASTGPAIRPFPRRPRSGSRRPAGHQE